MSKDPKTIQSVSNVDAPRPCAFYQAAMLPASHGRRGSLETLEKGTAAGSSGLTHRCMLNPGRASGPDGEEIGPLTCTLARQGACQTNRRKNIARLYATLPTQRAAEVVQA